MNSRALASICLLLVALLAVAFGQEEPDCALCADTHTLTCPSCDGDDVGLMPCDTCNGHGRAACRWEHPEDEPKKLYCPNPTCFRGVSFGPNDGMYPCQVCDERDSVKCKSCSEASKRRCSSCRGKGKRERECDPCAGSGKLPCLLCTDHEKCPTCSGSTTTACARCKGEKFATQACAACTGRKDHVCHACAGLAKLPCSACFGTAFVPGGKDGTGQPCKACKKKGTLRCKDCRVGVTKCAPCKATGERFEDCRLCGASGKASCPTCSETGYLVLEDQAGLLADVGDRVGAKALYGRAQRRAKKSLLASIARIEKLEKRRRPPSTSNPDKSREQLREEFERILERRREVRVTTRESEWARHARYTEAIDRIVTASDKLGK